MMTSGAVTAEVKPFAAGHVLSEFDDERRARKKRGQILSQIPSASNYTAARNLGRPHSTGTTNA